MELKMEKVYERDIDMLLINKFINDPTLPDLFLSRIGKHNCTVVSVEHSRSDTDGESDITVILQHEDHKIGLLIEDKIDAPAMEEQYNRYKIRGDLTKADGEYDEYHHDYNKKMREGGFTICPFCGGLVSLISSENGKDKFACDSCDMTIVTEHN